MLQSIISIGLPIFLFFLGYFTGSWFERRHFKSINEREFETRHMVVCNFVPKMEYLANNTGLVTGSTVVSLDYFKRFLATLRLVFGGRVKSFETLLDRARRESVLRMKQNALDQGYNTVINVRIETSNIAAGAQQNRTAGVEVLAFGTAILTP